MSRPAWIQSRQQFCGRVFIQSTCRQIQSHRNAKTRAGFLHALAQVGFVNRSGAAAYDLRDVAQMLQLVEMDDVVSLADQMRTEYMRWPADPQWDAPLPWDAK